MNRTPDMEGAEAAVLKMARRERVWRRIDRAGWIVAIALWVLGYLNLQAAQDKVDAEGKDRRDQACLGVELQHRQEITELHRAYAYYVTPPPQFEEVLKNPLSVAQVLELERDAKFDQDRYGVYVPPYCDDKGFGRPEPDPKMPERPPEADRVLSAPRALP